MELMELLKLRRTYRRFKQEPISCLLYTSKQLEAELGVQLLVRSTKDVILSEEGVLFYPYAVRLLETENEALAHLNKTEAKVKGTVTIAASSVPGNYILPRILKQTRLKSVSYTHLYM